MRGTATARSKHARRVGLTLVEVLLVLALMALALGMALPSFEPQVADRLHMAARCITADLDFVRDLAVSRNSKYCVQFVPESNKYVITHCGTDRTLDKLPSSPYYAPSDNEKGHPQLTIELDTILAQAGGVQLVAVQAGSDTSVETLEFQPLGGTNHNTTVQIWIAYGAGEQRRYLPIEVAPVTGLTTTGQLTGTAPK